MSRNDNGFAIAVFVILSIYPLFQSLLFKFVNFPHKFKNAAGNETFEYLLIQMGIFGTQLTEGEDSMVPVYIYIAVTVVV